MHCIKYYNLIKFTNGKKSYLGKIKMKSINISLQEIITAIQATIIGSTAMNEALTTEEDRWRCSKFYRGVLYEV